MECCGRGCRLCLARRILGRKDSARVGICQSFDSGRGGRLRVRRRRRRLLRTGTSRFVSPIATVRTLRYAKFTTLALHEAPSGILREFSIVPGYVVASPSARTSPNRWSHIVWTRALSISPAEGARDGGAQDRLLFWNDVTANKFL